VVATLMVALGGVPMTFDGAAVASTLEGRQQVIARGPVAAFLAIKQLGTNGGGFFGPNSTHPFENPSFFTNALAMISIILIPMASGVDVRPHHRAHAPCGRRVRRDGGAAGRQDRGFAPMYFETAPTQAFAELPVDAGHRQSRGQGAALRRDLGPDLGRS
jgi:potassium-transporting ATPase potassium-binding subunit